MSTAPSPRAKLPPVDRVGAVVIALVIAGGIDLGAHLPQKISLAPVDLLLAASILLVAYNVVSLLRVRDRFAWRMFLRVGRWALLAYLVIAGMLEYVFVLDGTRGSTLVVLTLMLAVFAVNIPMILAYSVARYQPVEPA
ncbi:MAG TPA: hypothetical protein VKY26_07520 [Actinomycetota bacterium]|nr:hypothetical protein [Actinomycetota bacterium]